MGTITSLESTFLKKRPLDSSRLSPVEKVGCLPGRVYKFSSIEQAKDGHRKVVLEYGAGSWYIFSSHWQVDTELDKSTIDPRCIAIVKEFEGLELEAYVCPAGVITIGFGSTFYPDGRSVKMGDEITIQQAEDMLLVVLSDFQSEVIKRVDVDITASMLAALTSFTFNVGVGAFSDSTLLKELNAARYTAAADQMLRWVRGDGRVLPGLVRRRQAEKRLFLEDGLVY